MTRFFSILMILISLTALPLQAGKKLSLDDIFASTMFAGKSLSGVQWLPDGQGFVFTRANNRTGDIDIYRHDVRSGEEKRILSGDKLTWNGAKVTMTAYQTTGEANLLLITGDRKQIWRHSFSAPYYLYDVSSGELQALVKGDRALQNVELSPDGASVAFVKENDLYVADVATGKARRLTKDGSFNILNGVFDWVYEEEFGRPDAYRWSPDGKRIAFWRSDQTRVKTFHMIKETDYYSEVTPLKYPKAGEQNAIVKIGVATLETGDITWMDLGSNDDIYIPRIHWTNDPQTLAIQRLNRLQNHLELLLADVATGKTRLTLEDRDPAWIDITDDVIFLKETNRFLITSEKDGRRHIYLHDYSGKLIKQLTSGDWEVIAIDGVDETAGDVYFSAHQSPTTRDLCRVSLDGGPVADLSKTKGWHSANFAPNFKHYVARQSAIDTPPSWTLRTSKGAEVRVLEDNPIPALKEYDMVYPELGVIKTTDGTELSSYMMKPSNFDPSKKYPVLVFGYGGPGSQMVINRWGTGSAFRHLQRILWHQYMTEQGYIIFCVDNRGTGGRGKAFKNLAYGDLSKWSVHDQIEGAKYLASLPYVDASRIGFWGWSGGGYLTCLIMTRAADYFTTGVAVASVSDFRNYDTIWTERYMGLPTDNKAGYDAANVNAYAPLLKGNLLLVHGSGDDNVHPGNTLQFVDALIAENKQFDMMIYPNRNHRIHGGNTMRHLFTKITDFFLENL